MKENREEYKEIGLDQKRGPRSRTMEAIILLLHARPLRASEIATNLGFESKYVSSYLSYWKRRGVVYQEGGRWYLTDKGEMLVSAILDEINNTRFNEYLALAKQLVEVKQTKKDKKEGGKDKTSAEVLSFIGGLTSKGDKKRQRDDVAHIIQCIENQEQYGQLTDDEREVLLGLIKHYLKWGSTYMYLEQLQQELGADRSWLFNILKLLQSKKCIYIYNDPKLGTRIGLSKGIKDLVNECL